MAMAPAKGLGAGKPAPAAAEGKFESPTAQFGEVDEGNLEQPTEEEQAQFETFERQMMGILYPENSDGQVNPQILANLKGEFDPSALELFASVEPALTDSRLDSLAATSVLVTMMVEQTGEYTDDVVLHGGKGVLEDLVEIAEAAKLHDFSEKDMESATYRAMDLYRIASPRADKEALTGEFKRLADASAAGNLASILPGLPGGAALPQGGAQ